MIDALEAKIRETKNQLIIRCKNFQTFQVDFNNPTTCLSINKSLDLLSNLSNKKKNLSYCDKRTAAVH